MPLQELDASEMGVTNRDTDIGAEPERAPGSWPWAGSMASSPGPGEPALPVQPPAASLSAEPVVL